MGMTAGVGVAVYVSTYPFPYPFPMLTKSSLTMFIGTLFVRFIRMIRGEPREAPEYVDRKMDIVEFIAADEEKAGLMEHQEAPPQYEDEPSRN